MSILSSYYCAAVDHFHSSKTMSDLLQSIQNIQARAVKLLDVINNNNDSILQQYEYHGLVQYILNGNSNATITQAPSIRNIATKIIYSFDQMSEYLQEKNCSCRSFLEIIVNYMGIAQQYYTTADVSYLVNELHSKKTNNNKLLCLIIDYFQSVDKLLDSCCNLVDQLQNNQQNFYSNNQFTSDKLLNLFERQIIYTGALNESSVVCYHFTYNYENNRQPITLDEQTIIRNSTLKAVNSLQLNAVDSSQIEYTKYYQNQYLLNILSNQNSKHVQNHISPSDLSMSQINLRNFLLYKTFDNDLTKSYK